MRTQFVFKRLLAIIILLTSFVGIVVAQTSLEKTAQNDISALDKSNLLLLPPQNDGEKIPVEIAFRVLNLENIEESQQDFTIVGYLTAQWKDPRLAFTPVNPKQEYQVYQADQVWVPHFDFANGVVPHSAFDVIVHVYPDGTVKYYERSSATLSNVYFMYKFPFDTQNLKLIVQPSISEDDIVAFFPRDVDPITAEEGAFSSMVQWQVLSASSEAIEVHGVNNNTVNAATFNIEIKRDATFYIWKVFLPLLLMVILSWTVFWIHPSELSSQAQISVTTILTVIAFSFAIATSLPKVPYLTLIDKFFLICYFFVFITAIEITCMHLLGRKNNTVFSAKVQRFSRVVLPILFVLLICGMLFRYLVLMEK